MDTLTTMIKNETFLNTLNKKVDERRGWTEEFGAIYEEFGADELEEFARWGYEQALKDIKEELDKRLDLLWNKIPDASGVDIDNISKEQAFDSGKYNAVESFRSFVDTLG